MTQIQLGRFLVFVAIISASMVSAVNDLWVAHFSLVNWLLMAALFYALWRGQPWARWLLVGLTGLTPLVGVWFLRVNPFPFFIGLLICYMIVAILLAFPPSISVFLAYQRTRSAANLSPQPPRESRKRVDPY